MIKRTTFVYTKEEIQGLIDSGEVVRVLFGIGSFTPVTMIIRKQLQGYYQPVTFSTLPREGRVIIGALSNEDGNGLGQKYNIPIDDIRRIEVLDDEHAIVWKLENGF